MSMKAIKITEDQAWAMLCLNCIVGVTFEKADGTLRRMALRARVSAPRWRNGGKLSYDAAERRNVVGIDMSLAAKGKRPWRTVKLERLQEIRVSGKTYHIQRDTKADVARREAKLDKKARIESDRIIGNLRAMSGGSVGL